MDANAFVETGEGKFIHRLVILERGFRCGESVATVLAAADFIDGHVGHGVVKVAQTGECTRLGTRIIIVKTAIRAIRIE